jgi:hypothetical protein
MRTLGLGQQHHNIEWTGDGHRLIGYATNYTTRVGVSKFDTKTILEELSVKGEGFLDKFGEETWSKEKRVVWPLSNALQKMVGWVPVTQVEATYNLMGEPVFFCMRYWQDCEPVFT